MLLLLIVAQFAVAGAPARADGSLRHLEYSVSSNLDGRAVHGTIRLDLRAVRLDHSFDFDLEDDIGGLGSETFSIDLDQRGGMNVYGANALRHEEEALMYFFALSHENMTGVDAGDHWIRENATADGSQVTNYTVLHANGELVDLGVARALAHRDGSTENWRGHLIYDSASIVPVLIELSGVDSKLRLKLTSDSFKRE
jgi:hypothetical protein